MSRSGSKQNSVMYQSFNIRKNPKNQAQPEDLFTPGFPDRQDLDSVARDSHMGGGDNLQNDLSDSVLNFSKMNNNQDK